MARNDNRITMLQIPLIEEKNGRAALISLVVHGVVLFLMIFGIRLFPQAVVQIGSGQGGSFNDADIATVGLVDQFSGGAGTTKPSFVPQPPVLIPETTPVKTPKIDESAIPIPEKVVSSKPEIKTEPKPELKPEIKTEPKSEIKPESAVKKSAVKPKEQPPLGNIVPVEKAQPGSGGVASNSSGDRIGGSGISIGTGSGGIGDSWYAQVVEGRISSGWLRPPADMRVEMIYSFYINTNGIIYDIKQEKSSGNSHIDLTAVRAINSANPLNKPPLEFQGKAIQFVARFVHPPDYDPGN